MSETEHSQAGTTRGKLLALLCSADRTTRELAGEMGISPNGVREQVARLEEEGLVERRVVRRGVGKPAHEYRLSEKGSLRISRAYFPMLRAMLSALEQRGGVNEEEELLRAAGRILARQYPRPDGTLRERVEAAGALHRELGGLSTLSEESGEICIQGTCCPLRALVPGHPLACRAIETMLSEFIGAPVREHCDKRDPPSCRLVIGGTVHR